MSSIDNLGLSDERLTSLEESVAVDARWLVVTLSDVADVMNRLMAGFEGKTRHAVELSTAVVADERATPSYQACDSEEDLCYCALQLAWSALGRASKTGAWERAVRDLIQDGLDEGSVPAPNAGIPLRSALLAAIMLEEGTFIKAVDEHQPLPLSEEEQMALDKEVLSRTKRAIRRAMPSGADANFEAHVLATFARVCLEALAEWESHKEPSNDCGSPLDFL